MPYINSIQKEMSFFLNIFIIPIEFSSYLPLLKTIDNSQQLKLNVPWTCFILSDENRQPFPVFRNVFSFLVSFPLWFWTFHRSFLCLRIFQYFTRYLHNKLKSKTVINVAFLISADLYDLSSSFSKCKDLSCFRLLLYRWRCWSIPSMRSARLPMSSILLYWNFN